jgi:transcriptional regulator with XRE-family HTH domain
MPASDGQGQPSSEEVAAAFGQRLVMLREHRGWSTEQFASQVSLTTVAELERGEHLPRAPPHVRYDDAANGVPLRKLQEWLGHANITTTQI